MITEDTISINIVVADRPYRLKIKPQEEEVVRKAAKKINEQLRNLQNTYDAKDKQDYLAMSILMNTTELLNLKANQSHEDENLISEISTLDKHLSDILPAAE